ncbi:hypothetical protein ACKWTF_006888 [Chironomus riparius]
MKLLLILLFTIVLVSCKTIKSSSENVGNLVNNDETQRNQYPYNPNRYPPNRYPPNYPPQNYPYGGQYPYRPNRPYGQNYYAPGPYAQYPYYYNSSSIIRISWIKLIPAIILILKKFTVQI